MSRNPIVIRKHAILKRHYRRAVRATPQFHELDAVSQWAVLRRQVEQDVTPTGARLLTIMDAREARREEVLKALEQARRDQIR
jgi:hypothetical protein